MKQKKTFWAIVPAAGVGKRMVADRPKQYLELHHRTVIEHSLQRLLDVPAISGAIVSLDVHDQYWPELKFSHEKSVVTVAGGAERYDSVLNALNKLKEIIKVDSNDEVWVLVHDAARPCVRAEDLIHLIEVASHDDHGGLLALPVRDTMKRTQEALFRGSPEGESLRDETNKRASGTLFRGSPEGESLRDETNKRQHQNNRVQTTVDRTGLWHALTPQMFKLDLLINALQQAQQKGLQVTDDASAMELAGYHPLLVEGHEDNIKITRPFDLQLASLYIKEFDHD
ncbi:MAG: 2-C-methyl-D-erythritol 4-phosphate cytidylyltransferase [Gammaproteobacteria bacterium]|nr:2-C-methyl-D-erythritol 4-phosphate cytidylyltransferase [Gammaproteobacteria bacterium]